MAYPLRTCCKSPGGLLQTGQALALQFHRRSAGKAAEGMLTFSEQLPAIAFIIFRPSLLEEKGRKASAWSPLPLPLRQRSRRTPQSPRRRSHKLPDRLALLLPRDEPASSTLCILIPLRNCGSAPREGVSDSVPNPQQHMGVMLFPCYCLKNRRGETDARPEDHSCMATGRSRADLFGFSRS